MKRIRFIVIFLFFVALSCSKDDNPDVELRLGNFLVESSKITIKLTSLREQQSEVLSYGDLTSYLKIKPGSYEIEVFVRGKKILNKKIGLGKGAKFTLFVYGVVGNNSKMNQTTTTTSLHKIVSGAEANTDNGYLPQIRLIDDIYQGDNAAAKMRCINLVVYEKAFAVKGQSDNSTIDFGSSSYGKEQTAKKLDPGDYQFIWTLEDSPVVRLKSMQHITKGTLYTFFLIPQVGTEFSALEVVTGESLGK